MRKLFFLLTLGFLWSGAWVAVAQAEIKAYFTPSDLCEKNVVALLLSAENKIDIAIYSFTSEKIANAVMEANENPAVKVRILADRLQASGKYSQVKKLYEQGVNIRVHSVNRFQHNKYIVVDGKKFMTGSFNFTESASKRNAENCLFVSDEWDRAQDYQNDFDNLWKKNLKRKSDEWFSKK